MIKKLLTRCLILSIMMTLAACATIKPVNERATLRSELAKWTNFRADGVVQATYSGLSLRKMFVLQKKRHSL